MPIFLSGFLVDFLRGHFSRPLGIQTPDLRRNVWRDDERTGILLATSNKWDGLIPEKRPAVIVRQNGYRQYKAGIGNQLGPTPDGNLEFATYWIGSHTLMCLAGLPLQAQMLAHEVATLCSGFAWVFKGQGGLTAFDVQDVGAAGRVEEVAEEHRAVPVTVGWAILEEWTLEYAAARRLAKVDLTPSAE